jgi:hypothetical protein
MRRLVKRKKQEQESPACTQTEAQIWSGLLGIAIFAVYLLTLSPTIPPGDSGEFITVAATSGVAHPSGYPAFVLLSHVIAWLPFGSFAWRINLLSSLASIGAAFFIFFTVFRLTRNQWASLIAMGLFAFSPLIWRYSLVAEVFALNNFFLAGFLYFFVRFLEDPSPRSWYVLILSLALGLTNHHTLGLVGFPILIYCAIANWKLLLNPKVLTVSLLLGIFAQAPYLYLPIAASQQPVVSWGDASTWEGFLTHLLRREYGTLTLAPAGTGTPFWRAIWEYLIAVPVETLYVGIALAVYGLLGKSSVLAFRHFNRATLLGFVTYMALFNGLANLDLTRPLWYDVYTRFWQQANLIVFLWLGLGVHLTLKRVPWLKIGLLLLIPIQITLNYAHEDQSDNFVFYNQGRSVLDMLPPNALFISSGDLDTNTVRYLQQVEGFRTDVTVVDLNLLRTSWYRSTVEKHYPQVRLPEGKYAYPAAKGSYDLLALLSANQSHPLFMAPSAEAMKDESWNQTFDHWPFGFAIWVIPKARTFSLDRYIEDTELDRLSIRGTDFKHVRRRSWDWSAQRKYWNVESRRVRKVLSHVLKMKIRPDLVVWAKDRLEFLIHENPSPQPQVYRDLGFAYGELAEQDESMFAKQIEAWDRYLRMDQGPVLDPDFVNIRNFMREHQSD